MLIRITGPADVTMEDGTPVTADAIIRELDGAESEDECSNYLDLELADLGITGGKIKLIYNRESGQFSVQTDYFAPDRLTPEQLARLANDTAMQWSDGLGSGCFVTRALPLGVSIGLGPLDPVTETKVEQIDDGTTPGPPKTLLATAARTGDMTTLRRLFDEGADTEIRLQGYTPLQMAILYGQTEAALELIRRGADVNALDPLGEDCLTKCATSRFLQDSEAASVAHALLEGGASVHGSKGPNANPDLGQYTPLFLATLRKKTELAAVLKEHGGRT
jgi:hypothetical protein